MTTIAVQNQSTELSDANAALMVTACQYQMTNHAAKLLGRKAWTVTFVPKGHAVPKGAYSIVILDDPDQADALGYHTEDPDGKIWGRVFVKPVLSNKGTALTGSLSVSAVLSHEVLETYMDKSVNLWSDRLNGTMVAYEVADPVENDSYVVHIKDDAGKTHAVSVSNFVLDAWFDAQADNDDRFDFLHNVTAPLTMSSGGYIVILNTKTGKTSQQFGSELAQEMHELKKPTFSASRTSRRMAGREE